MFHLCGCDNYFEVKIWFVLFFPSVIAITELIEKKNRISVKYFDTFVFFFFFDFLFFFEHLLNIRLLKFRESFQSRFPRDQLQFYFYKNLF